MTASQRPTSVHPASIATGIRAAWDDDQDLDASTLAVRVDPGGNVVELDGDVGSHVDRLSALVLAIMHAPHLPVRNRIVVRSRFPRPVDDPAVGAAVQAALARVDGATAVRVDVVEHVVALHGTVPDVTARITVHGTAARTPGVDFVEDHLVVSDDDDAAWRSPACPPGAVSPAAPAGRPGTGRPGTSR